ncbi:unnamed protein product [Ambrosiozyma monospora]|uniref:Unnamed protein product n=1 Tax=Ambrosiozyma monospora TaxID=43982 RepID=A0ACB5U4A8_AMBMO|nr:unnamed protein product [Ambrosiozyma monospora]
MTSITPQALKTPAPAVTPTLTAPIPVLALPQTPPESPQTQAELQDQQLSQLKYPKENEIFQTPPPRSRLSTPGSGFIHHSPTVRFSSGEVCYVDTTLRMSHGKVSVVDPQSEEYDEFDEEGNEITTQNPTIRLSSGSGLANNLQRQSLGSDSCVGNNNNNNNHTQSKSVDSTNVSNQRSSDVGSTIASSRRGSADSSIVKVFKAPQAAHVKKFSF